MNQPPKWAREQQAERVESKAARLAALYLMRDKLPDVPKVKMAEAMGISRWTYDRLLASLAAVDSNVTDIEQAIEKVCK